jgi:hypothetical protein
MNQKRKFGKWGFLFILSLPFLLFSCYPGGPEYVEDMDLVATKYDSTFNFSNVITYIMPDTVMPVYDPDHPEDAEPINKQLQKLILDEMADQFDQLGYERIFDTINGYPDAYVTISSFTSTYIGYYYDYWYYWWGYYPYWPPYWGGYYPYYPWGGAYMYSYTTGTVLFQMMDPRMMKRSPSYGLVPSTDWLKEVHRILLIESSAVSSKCSSNHPTFKNPNHQNPYKQIL